MRVVYIASSFTAPTRAERDANRARAARWVAWAAGQGVAPVATWIVLTGELEETPENRELGLAIDCATVERCDECWLVGGKITDGMRRESSRAKLIVDLTHLGDEPPEILDPLTAMLIGAGFQGTVEDLRTELVAQGGYRSGRKIF